ncbi:MAG: FAD-dependent oxidoreductase [Rhizobiales bacterium]|nr:FAD-dependent oxidoreductase [Hyphomicrobiales bacterium]
MAKSGSIAIIGGGIGGLAAAVALLRRGIDVTVYEQAPELHEIGAGIQISANGTRVLHALGLAADLAEVEFIPTGKEIRLWNTGQTWKLFDLGAESVARYGFPYITIHRGDLHQVLIAGVRQAKPDAIVTGHKCTGLTQDSDGVVLTFENGAAVWAPLAIGADGIHSIVRQSLFGPDNPEFTGIVTWRGVVPMEALPPQISRTVGTNWVGPGAHVIHYPLRRGELLNFVGLVERSDWTIESWTVQGTQADLARDFRGWHDDVHAMIRLIEAPYIFALKGRSPMPSWSMGRATLLGDACHPMLPMLAQGAVMALEDALILARCIAAYSDHTVAFAHYEAARKERTARAVNGSAENAKRFHNQALSRADEAEAYVTREWQEDRVTQRYEWLFTYDATGVDV